MKNKCEESNLIHAWIGSEHIIGFSSIFTETCANCGLKRQKHYECKEWYSYFDGRPDEPIYNTRAV